MKVELSKQFSDWLDDKDNNQFKKGVEVFLDRVYKASDVSQVTPKAKTVGQNLGIGGTVPEFSVARCRIYGRIIEGGNGDKIMRLAVIGIKGKTNQNSDIENAVWALNGTIDTQWSEWVSVADDTVAEVVADKPVETVVEPQSVVAPKKSSAKCKPVDENGLTAKERKKLQKEQQMAKAREQQAEKRAKKQAEKVAQETKGAGELPPVLSEPQEHEPAQPVKPESGTEIIPDDTPVQVVENTKKQSDDVPSTLAEPTSDITVDTVTINDVQQPQTPKQPIATDTNFKDLIQEHYELEIIKRKKQIANIQIQVQEYKIKKGEQAIASQKRIADLEAQIQEDKIKKAQLEIGLKYLEIQELELKKKFNGNPGR